MMEAQFEYINQTYGVSFKRGQRIVYDDGLSIREGTVKGASNYVRVQFDDGPRGLSNIHPRDPGLRTVNPEEAGTP